MNLQLKEAREKQGYTIEAISEKLKIRKQYLLDIENGDYENMPGDVYIRGYIKTYCNFLGISPPKFEEKDKIVAKTLIQDRKLNKYIVAIICLLLLLVTFTLYYKYKDSNELEDNNLNTNLINLNESNQTIFD